ncbi:hypothetical protein Mp_3g16930 [Marchantia polymorpha subsp. ruderalis]|uniref:Uncharacterized protein n=2 Tax=Marchantia polymorpha TaxID=3197 RepID=A0AAF6B1M6_MARPO|nr:hypothetical protein MARPO_0039s0102 [Marchantia polymorpha]BBN05910.1 hypothetical protein Mp_3g16930 [Marchantia polymorpha subsp. ruderalis]|eukprot:PTQ40615.1 hypothetical protein MARPO_0039s0102 [Marchantia polymorpha]
MLVLIQTERSRCAAAVIVDLEYSRRKSREQSDQRGDVSTRQTRQSRGKIRPKAERALRSRGRKPDPQTHRRTDGRTDCTTTGATLLALLEKIPKEAASASAPAAQTGSRAAQPSPGPFARGSNTNLRSPQVTTSCSSVTFKKSPGPAPRRARSEACQRTMRRRRRRRCSNFTPPRSRSDRSKALPRPMNSQPQHDAWRTAARSVGVPCHAGTRSGKSRAEERRGEEKRRARGNGSETRRHEEAGGLLLPVAEEARRGTLGHCLRGAAP